MSELSFIGEFYISQSIKTVGDSPVAFTIDGSTITVGFDKNTRISASGLSGSVEIYKFFDTEILWDFGDGETVRGKTATHHYSKPGVYHITCTCFDKDGVPYKNILLKDKTKVAVYDILPTILNFTREYISEAREGGILDNIYAGETAKVGEIIASLAHGIDELPVECEVLNSKSPSYEELKYNTPYTHLLPYHYFSEKIGGEPIKNIFPKFKDVYATFINGDEGTELNLYILGDENHITTPYETLEIGYFTKVNYEVVDSLDEIEEKEYFHCGKVAIFDVYFTDDIPSEQPLSTIFSYNPEFLSKKDDLFSKNIVNLVSIGTEVTFKKNSLNEPDKTYELFYSTCGLTTNQGYIIDNMGLGQNDFSYDRAKYVGVEDPFVVRVVATHSDGNGRTNQYFAKDISIVDASYSLNVEPSTPVVGDISLYTDYQSPISGKTFNDYGSCHCSFTPQKETQFSVSKVNNKIVWGGTPTYFRLTFSLRDFNNSIDDRNVLIKISNVIDKKSFGDTRINNPYFLNPKQKHTEYSVEEFWEVYKTHPAFAEVPNLDKFITSVFGGPDEFLQKTINKGNNFLDDIVNVETCEIKNLLSLVQLCGMTVEQYSDQNFNHPIVMEELMKIFSITHSKLIGTKIHDEYIFEEWDGEIGPNRSEERIDINDRINVPYTVDESGEKHYSWPKLVGYDRFTKKYFIINTSVLEYTHPKPYHEDTQTGEVYFKLSEYTDSWGWTLLLGDEEYFDGNILATKKTQNESLPVITKQPKGKGFADVIEKFYYFYYYVENDSYTRKESYLQPSSLSQVVKINNIEEKIDNDNIVNYETWTKVDGSMDRLLHKTFLEGLRLG